MQARLETRRFPAAAVAVVFAVVAVFLISAGSGYAIKSLSTTAQKAPATVRQAVQGGPTSDLTRALPQAPVLKAQGGPQSDLTRALPKAPKVQGGPDSDLTRALPGQQTGGDSSFDTCTRLVHKVC